MSLTIVIATGSVLYVVVAFIAYTTGYDDGKHAGERGR